jgi:hypothetical protein
VQARYEPDLAIRLTQGLAAALHSFSILRCSSASFLIRARVSASCFCGLLLRALGRGRASARAAE